jgi:hypothetical protein
MQEKRQNPSLIPHLSNLINIYYLFIACFDIQVISYLDNKVSIEINNIYICN